jgi:C4-dicarboxylate transporter DctQ subunit
MALLLFRFVQVFVRLLRGQEASLIVSHEVEEAVAEVKHLNAKD